MTAGQYAATADQLRTADAAGATIQVLDLGLKRFPEDPTLLDLIEQAKNGVHSHQAVQGSGKPDEIASLAVYLASEPAWYITGQCYLANGGAYFQ